MALSEKMKKIITLLEQRHTIPLLLAMFKTKSAVSVDLHAEFRAMGIKLKVPTFKGMLRKRGRELCNLGLAEMEALDSKDVDYHKRFRYPLNKEGMKLASIVSDFVDFIEADLCSVGDEVK